ncbi:MBL fold metallo-hydrolase [Methanoculleus sp. FWC-SCC1]|uniref:MBL fold metallo-hydrolase n=1 Tax=Methanoculleus frigidifontis TaxID=2584085 RepID=A0ABT8M9B0_9EURY|nr:MBL fold metallo-hydrolase [Methanoculleus sp. FWC-SCC1]MDN7024505.1 MBL fold metallo-hydrolase [Methanoculleus sp. FWC-SCC1]
MQVTDHIHLLKIPFRLSAGPGITVERFVNCFLIYGSEICLVDAGVAGAEEAVFSYLHRTGRKPDEIGALVLTHAHPDHLGAATTIQEATGCTVIAHLAERAWIEDVDLQARERPVPDFHTLVAGSVAVDRFVEGGDTVHIDGGLDLAVLHTPGHSPGSISLHLPADGALITGDAVPLPRDLPVYDDAAASVRSIRSLMEVPDVTHLLASWDDPRSGGEVSQTLADGLLVIRRFHEAVLRAGAGEETCRRVIEDLGLPAFVLPVVVRTCRAHLAVGDSADIICENSR